MVGQRETLHEVLAWILLVHTYMVLTIFEQPVQLW
jgi:hypothetical protein